MSARSDKLFQRGRRKDKNSLARKAETKKTRKRALIVCEGEKTEPLYLNALIRHLGLTTADVRISGECGSAPLSVVKHGKDLLRDDSDYDFVFFVFDRDTHPNYDNAINSIYNLEKKREHKPKTIAAITSVPCFELWFLMHFSMHSRPYDAEGDKSPAACLISDLKQIAGFEDYEKASTDHFTKLLPNINTAKSNSVRRLIDCRNSGERDFHGNPSTKMHLLVSALEEIANDSNDD
ncbi:MAG: RloB domain-containing protein [Methylocystaceae bacterium]|nr:RloB domain-containing protein [Methylocystaceae bacterium]